MHLGSLYNYISDAVLQNMVDVLKVNRQRPKFTVESNPSTISLDQLRILFQLSDITTIHLESFDITPENVDELAVLITEKHIKNPIQRFVSANNSGPQLFDKNHHATFKAIGLFFIILGYGT